MVYNNLIKYRFLIVLWMGFIFLMSTTTFSAANTSMIIEPILRFISPKMSVATVHLIHGIVRKCGHVTEYFILGLLLFHAFEIDPATRKLLSRAFYSLVIVVIFALSDEYHQSFVATRTASLVDVSIDAFGGFLAQCLNLLLNRRRE
jgi:VanZ family protein